MAGARIQLKRATASQWTSANTVLFAGEIGYETDTNKFKIGDGTAGWTSLSYFNGNLSGSNLNDLLDVTITSAANGDFLRWNGTAWINDAVNLSTDTVGSFVESLVAGTGIALTNNSGEAATPTVSLNATLDNLTDAVITSPLEYESLVYNGTNWVNQYASNATYVRNAEATTLTTGTVVYLFGAVGDHATVKRADNDSDATSSKTVGIVASPIAASENGPVVTRGYVDGIDLSTGYASGDILWLGEDGAFTKVKPTAPEHLVFVGVVVRASVNGIIYVATQNGYELDELHDVSIVDKISGDFLKYNGTLWVNDQINLGTDTTGNYVNDVTAGTGVTVTHTPGEGSSPTVAIGQAVATSDSPSFAGLNLNGNIVFEGTTANDFETTVTVTDPTADRTITFPNATGTVALGQPVGTTDVVYFEAVFVAQSGIGFNYSPTTGNQHRILANEPPTDQYLIYLPDASGTVALNGSIALGTDTTGNYVNDVTAGTGVTVTHTPGEGSSPTVAIGQSVATSASPTFANVTISSAPTDVNHAATKAYVDYYAAGVVWHDAVKLGTAAALPGTPTYDNGTSGVGATLTATSDARLIIDGANATTNDRVLVKDQADAKQNGVYVVTAQGSVSAPYVLTRATDFDASPSFENLGASGNAVYVTAGSSSSNQGFITLSTGTGTNGTYVIGTDDITFGQFTGTATFTAGAGLATTGNVVNVQTANAARIVVNSDDIDLATVTRTNTSGSAGKSFIQSFTTDSYGRVTGAVTADTAITLGTDTSGSYVESLTAGTGITLSGNSGEGASPTVAVTANTYDAYGAAATAQTNAESTASGYVSTHAALTTTHGVSGAIVGTSDAQTLTNKTLTSPNVDGSGVIFEGTTANDFETTVTVVDPTADRTITLPDATGTVALTSDITSAVDAITTTAIEEGTNQYFTDERAQDAVGNAVGTGLTYTDSTGAISVTANTYDAYGAAATAQTNAESTASGYVSTHAALTTTHGVSGAIVGTSDAQTLTNKTLTSPNINENVALTATATELNILDGATLSTTELNYVDGVTSAIQTQIDTKAPIANPTFTGTVTLAADPSSALHAATKQYVDNTAAGVVAKPSVLAATTTNIDATYSNGTLGVGATLTANSNGVFPSDFGGASGWAQFKGILVKNQTNKEENGRYFVSDMGSVSTPYVLTRCGYCDEASEIPGAYIFVQDGTLAGTGWIQVVADPPTFVVGTDDIDVFQFSGAGTYLGGDGLVLTDNTFSVGTASTGRIVVNADNIDLASGIAAIGTYQSVTVDTYGRVTAGTNPTTLSGYGITDAAPINNASFTGTFSAPTGTITSTMIADATIVDADISTTAAIDLGKLADISTNAQTASYTLVLADKNKLVEMSVGSGNTLTVPPDSSVAFPVGTQIRVLQTNTGQCTLTPGAGVTINGTPGLKLRTQWASATLIKRATDTWVAVGDLSV